MLAAIVAVMFPTTPEKVAIKQEFTITIRIFSPSDGRTASVKTLISK